MKWIQDFEVLEIRYAGEVNYEYRLDTLAEIEQATPSEGLHRMLINYTSAWPAEAHRETDARAAFGARIASLRFAANARVALVNAPQELGARTDRASVTAGFVFRHFDDRELALAWLMAPYVEEALPLRRQRKN